MKKTLSQLEDQLQEISENNQQIKAISSVLNENWDGLSSINKRDATGQLTRYEVERVLERTETLFSMLITLAKDIEEKNSKVLDDITKIGRELV
ncbi:hypothetical protein [Carnobacterium pleistocenium]|uniref:hypothetical protein n=1 Tax=Carnobacterium pleistocenium TaxID=181073 RepID=UPI0005528AF4|nr:hypothetical protein [Carnobacterium pleistocenium]